MSDPDALTADPAPEAVASVNEKLKLFRATLTDNEQRMLNALFYLASDPIDRMLMREGAFSAEEEAVLEGLKNESR
jgi:hypothetical protein